MIYKIKITDPQSFYKEFEDGSCIGGQYGEPITLNLHLSRKEHEALLAYRKKSDGDTSLELFSFLFSDKITDWHKRQIRRYFKTLPKGMRIEYI